MKRLALVTLVLALSANARGEEPRAAAPGVAAIDSAKAALARLVKAAAAPPRGTEALAGSLKFLEKLGDPPGPEERGQSIDSAAQPFLASVEPELVSLREEILDRRHRFLTGEDRPQAARPELVTAVFDARTILGTWRDEDATTKKPEPIAPSVETSPAIVSRPIHFHAEALQAWAAAELDDGGEGYSVEVQGNALYVRAPRDGVQRVAALLDVFRAAAGRRLALEVKAYRMSRELWLEQRSAADPEAVLERAVAASKATLLEARSCVVEDGALATMAAATKRATLAGEEVNQTGVVPVLNPRLGSVELGLRGDVRPTLAQGRRDAVVDVDLAYRELKATKRETVSGQELDLPETTVTRLATTLTVPLGRTVLVGGTFAGSEQTASACVFAIRTAPFGSHPEPAPVPSRPEARTKTGSEMRAEVKGLEQLLAVVEDALAAVQGARRHECAIFDVRDLLEGVHARKAPRLGAYSPPPRKSGGGSFAFDDDSSEAVFGYEPDKLEQLVKNSTGADAAWSSGGARYGFEGWQVVVRQTPGTIAAIRGALDSIRKDRSGNVECFLEWCRVEDGLLAEATRGGAGLEAQALAPLDAALAEGTRAAREAQAFLLVERGDVGVLHAGSELAYIADYEQSSGGTGSVVRTVAGPILGLVRQGLTIEALGHGDASTTHGGSGEGALVLDTRVGSVRLAELSPAHTPAGPIGTPVLDLARGSFDGLVPGGALALIVDRRAAEARPAVVALIRARVVR